MAASVALSRITGVDAATNYSVALSKVAGVDATNYAIALSTITGTDTVDASRPVFVWTSTAWKAAAEVSWDGTSWR